MKRTNMLLILMMVGLLLASCGSFNKGKAEESIDEVDVEYLSRDSTVYGICGRESSMNSLQLVTDAGDTLMLPIFDAQEAGKVFGGIKTGDRLAVICNRDSTTAVMVINLSDLLGDWVMEDPIDGSGEVGISIKDGGVAESINYTTIQYVSWRLINGKLEVVNNRDDGVDFEEVGLYDILYIGPDSLAYKNDEESFSYHRQRPSNEPHYVDTEDTSFDDFLY
jgi:hypothetical protein